MIWMGEMFAYSSPQVLGSSHPPDADEAEVKDTGSQNYGHGHSWVVVSDQRGVSAVVCVIGNELEPGRYDQTQLEDSRPCKTRHSLPVCDWGDQLAAAVEDPQFLWHCAGTEGT